MEQGADVLEIETKYDVPSSVAIPGLSGLPHVDRVASPAVVELDAAYYDTADLDLLGLGITLRRRVGGDDEGWHLKLPAEGGRHELREPLKPGDTVPPRLSDILAGVLRGARLREVGTISTRREVTALLDPDGRVIAELCDDHVTGVRRHRHRGEPDAGLSWREWELELLHVDAELATAAAERLVDAGASPAAYPSKLARTLGCQVPGGATRAHVGHRATARDVLAPYLAAQVRRLRQLDPMVRADLPDAVHQMRVTCRRIRAVLDCFRREFDPEVSRRFHKELGWVVQVLGGERDLEVLREQLAVVVGAHDTATAAEESWLDARLAGDLHEARASARVGLRSARYAEVLATLAEPDWPSWSPRAGRRSGPELERGLRRELAELMRAAAAADRSRGRARDHALHDVRKTAKRLRYAAEAVRPRFGSRAAELAGIMAELQDVLGSHHDQVVARATVRRLQRERSRAGLPHAAERIREDLAARKAAEELGYRRVGERLMTSDVRSWLRTRE